ncbi:hypothetical protein [Pandoraea anapnoica]|uniref:hypothetical protein n=1 Tax=Pandoraea anapnoica TaxID=2508301 RepID=UPI0012430862|nr:hypothetical protein [Pandoraea anapnoica]
MLNGPNLPIASLPGHHFSDRRLGELSRFNSTIAENARPPDSVFLAFLNNFTHMGPVDIIRDCFSSGGKKSEVLSRLARCHVATSSAGRDFLVCRDMLRQVNQDAWELLRGLTPAARETMLKGATLGARDLIVLTFPDYELRMPLESDCFGDGDGALSEAESRQLMMKRDDTDRTLIGNFAREQKRSHAGYYDSGVLRAWSSFLERCRGQMPIESFGGRDTFEALALAYRAVARGAATQANHAGIPLVSALRISAKLFDAADKPKASGLVWRDIAKHHHEAGETSWKIDALNRAGAKLSLAADLFLTLTQEGKAKECLEMAFDVYRESGNLAQTIRTGMALYERHIGSNFQSEARAVAAVVANTARRMGDSAGFRRWNALATQGLPVNDGVLGATTSTPPFESGVAPESL